MEQWHLKSETVAVSSGLFTKVLINSTGNTATCATGAKCQLFPPNVRLVFCVSRLCNVGC